MKKRKLAELELKRKSADLELQFQRMMMETRRQRIWEEDQRQEEETWSLHPLEDIDERYVVKSGKNDGNWLMEKFLGDCDQVRIDCDLRNKSLEQTRLKLLEMKLQVLREEIEEKRENQRLMRLFDEEQRRKRESMRLQLERDWNRRKWLREYSLKTGNNATNTGKDCTISSNDKKDNNDNANADDNDVDNDEMKNNQINPKDDDGEDNESANDDELMDDRLENCHGFDDDDGEAKNGQSDLDSDNIVLCNDNDVNNENYKERKNDFDGNNKIALRNSDYTINGKGDDDKKWKMDQKGGYETSITYLVRINPELKPLMSKKKKKRWKMEKGHVCRDGDQENNTHCSLSL